MSESKLWRTICDVQEPGLRTALIEAYQNEVLPLARASGDLTEKVSKALHHMDTNQTAAKDLRAARDRVEDILESK